MPGEGEADYIELEFVHEGRSHLARVLRDSGASLSLIQEDALNSICASGCCGEEKNCTCPKVIKVPDNRGISAPYDIILRVRVNDKTRRIRFWVVPGVLIPPIIIGNPALRRYPDLKELKSVLREFKNRSSRVASLSAKPDDWIQDRGDHLCCAIPGMSRIIVLPLKLQLRQRNDDDMRIIAALLWDKESKRQVAESRIFKRIWIVPVVLIDKKPGTVRDWRADDILDRYRITADLSYPNKAVVQVCGDMITMIPSSKSAEPKEPFIPLHYQPHARELIREFPTDCLQFFAKVDCKDAYSSVFLDESLRIFGTEIYDPNLQRRVCFVFNCIPQGWLYGPQMFRMAAQYVVDEVRRRVDEMKIRCHVTHMQDDFLAGAPTLEGVKTVFQVFCEVLRSKGFRVNDKKSIVGVEEVKFCGLSISRNGVAADPGKTKIDAALLDHFSKNWEDLAEREQRVSLLRQICGTFQFMYGNLTPEGAAHLKKLGRLQSDQSDIGSEASTQIFKDALTGLFHDFRCGLPRVNISNPCVAPEDYDHFGTLLIVDANIDSWGGIAIRFLPVTTDTALPSGPENQNLLNAIEELERCLRQANLPERRHRFEIVHLGGGLFSKTEQDQSSTWRERLAQMLFVKEIEYLLMGYVYVVSDNENVRKQWHEVEEHYQGKQLKLFNIFQRRVKKVLWLKRDGIVSYADSLARILSRQGGGDNSHQVNAVTTPHITLDNWQSDDRIAAACKLDQTRIQKLTISMLYRMLEVGHDPNEKAPSSYRHRWARQGDILVTQYRGGRRMYIPDIKNFWPSGTTGLREGLIDLAHSDCHIGVSDILRKLTERYYWPRMGDLVVSFVSCCMICRQTKAINRKRGEMSSTTKLATERGEQWHLDFADIKLRGLRKFTFIVGVCANTKFCVASLSKGSTAKDAIRFVVHDIIACYGSPKRLHTD